MTGPDEPRRDRARYVPDPAVAHREVEGQLLLLLPGDYDLYTLNATGALVWRELLAGRSPAEAAERLAERFDLPPERARADVERLVDELVGKGVLRCAE